MDHTLEVKRSVNINASVDKVWEAMTTPSIIAQYLYGTKTITDWKVGSDIIFQGEYEGQTYKDGGLIKAFDAPNLLTYSYWTSFSGLEQTPENSSEVSCIIEKENDGAKLTWHQKGYPDESRRKHSEDGMDEFLNSIKAIVEKE